MVISTDLEWFYVTLKVQRERKQSIDRAVFLNSFLVYFCQHQYGIVDGAFATEILDYQTEDSFTKATVKIPFRYGFNSSVNLGMGQLQMTKAKASSSAKKAKLSVTEVTVADDHTILTSDTLTWKSEKYSVKSEQKRKKWKNSKQILESVKGTESPNYLSIEAAPSIQPQNKYCDITGLPAPYLDPRTNIRYHSSSVFQFVREIPASTVQGYLQLRNAGVILK